jgi:septal ring factor EnvC (AmiA/AmiB activator)
LLVQQVIRALEKDRQSLQHRVASLESDMTRTADRLSETEVERQESDRLRAEVEGKATEVEVRSTTPNPSAQENVEPQK